MRWSEKETYQFAKLYLSHEYLWNPEHTNYRSKSRRLKGYKEIIAAMHEATGILLNEPEVKMKIRNLRSTYLQELLKIKRRSGPNVAYKPNVKWFGEWHKCFSGIKKADEEEAFDSQLDITDDTCHKNWLTQSEDNMVVETLDPFPEDDDEYTLILKAEPRDISHLSTDRSFQYTDSTGRYEGKKKKIKHRSPSTDCSMFRESIDYTNDSVAKDDEFDIYGKYIASQLRKMDLQKALKVQLQIQSLVSEARISGLNGKS